jgi:hypothetical protein
MSKRQVISLMRTDRGLVWKEKNSQELWKKVTQEDIQKRPWIKKYL